MPDIAISEYMKVRRYILNLIYQAGSKSIQVPSIQELSTMFNVSRPTVSKAMKSLVSDGYVVGRRGIGSFTNPNSVNSYCSNIQHKTPNIGVLITDGMYVCYSPFSSKILGSILNNLADGNNIKLISLTSSDPEEVYQEISKEHLDGLIWYTPPATLIDICQKLKNDNLALVIGDESFLGVSSVCLDRYKAGYDCGKLLIEAGKKHVAFLPNIQIWENEANGLKKAYREAGITLNEKLFLEDFSIAHEKILDMLSYGIPIDAIYSHHYADGELENYLLENSAEFSSDTIFVTSDIMPIKNSKFTQIGQNIAFDKFGAAIAKLLKKQLNGNKTPENIKIPISVILKDKVKKERGCDGIK